MERLTTDRGFWKAIGFSIITFGFYGTYLVYAFAKETNLACEGDGKHTRGLLGFILLTIVTFGIYAIVWYCSLIDRRGNFLIKNGKPEVVKSSTYLLTIFLLGNITLGIMHLIMYCKILYQQNAVNELYNEKLG